MLCRIDDDRQNANLSSAIRVFVPQHVRERLHAPHEQRPLASQPAPDVIATLPTALKPGQAAASRDPSLAADRLRHVARVSERRKTGDDAIELALDRARRSSAARR